MSLPTHFFPDLPKAPHALEAELVITTPMFLGSGGKDQHATSIRPPSIKGALRFWWRALQWPRLYFRFGNVATALSALHAKEAELFGLAAGHKDAQGNDIGEQGRFRIHIVQPNVNVSDRYQPPVSVRYLLGKGLYHFRKGLLRKPLQHGRSFTLVLAAKPGARTMTPVQWQSLEEALLCWGLLGGLGNCGIRTFNITRLTASD